jgi:hypothetical protein
MKMTENDNNRIFCSAGKVLFLCQKLEHDIAYLMYVYTQLGLSDFGKNFAIEVLDDECIKTLGGLIKVLKTKLNLPDNIEVDLKKGLDARNKFIHRFFIHDAKHQLSVETLERIAAIDKDVSAAQDHIDIATKNLTELHEAIMNSQDKQTTYSHGFHEMSSLRSDTREPGR